MKCIVVILISIYSHSYCVGDLGVKAIQTAYIYILRVRSLNPQFLQDGVLLGWRMAGVTMGARYPIGRC